MFNKLLIASASCINEFASEVPQSVFFSIDTSLAQRIRELAAYVKENDLYVAEFFFYDCLWSETSEGLRKHRDIVGIRMTGGFQQELSQIRRFAPVRTV